MPNQPAIATLGVWINAVLFPNLGFHLCNLVGRFGDDDTRRLFARNGLLGRLRYSRTLLRRILRAFTEPDRLGGSLPRPPRVLADLPNMAVVDS